MWKNITTVALALVFCAALSFAGRPQTILVQGYNNSLVDRQAVQDALDSAQPGDTVELVGTFQFDGVEVLITKSRLTLTGRPEDNDGDGEVNEDWADGKDNDGDGLFDEDDWDAVIRGLANPDGTPMEDFDLPTLTNRAIGIKWGFGDLKAIAIRHLKIDTVLRGVSMTGGHYLDSHFCDSFVATGYKVSSVVVERNWFNNVWRGAQAFGAVADATVRDNLVTGAHAVAFLAVGEEVACRVDEADEHPFEGVFSIDRPQQIRITGNWVLLDGESWDGISLWSSDRFTVRDNIVGVQHTGVYSYDGLKLSVSGNSVLGAEWGIVAEAVEQAHVMANYVTGALNGIVWFLDSPGSRITNNIVVDSLYHGAYLEEASELTLVNNEYWHTPESPRGADVFLDSQSHHNTVIATDFQTTVVDEGYDNKLIGTLAMIYNPGISDEVREHLLEVRKRLRERTP